jgi:asparagine synthase (glutamine-hydrolysing)
VFRYIALIWDDTVPQHAATAGRLRLELEARTGWQNVLCRAGLNLYLHDARRGINADYPVGPDYGVVLGRLFRRSELGNRPQAMSR